MLKILTNIEEELDIDDFDDLKLARKINNNL